MKNILYTVALVSISNLAVAQTMTENFVKSTTYQIATQNGELKSGTLIELTPDDKIETITYSDGLGRPKQSIAKQAGGNKEDIITPIVYDSYGRQLKEYLPYSRTNTSLNYMSTSNLITNLNSQYLNKYPDDLINIINPYSEKVMEASPLNRQLEQAAPGADWAISNSHTIKFDYQTNSQSQVRKYVVNYTPDNTIDSALSTSGFYSENTLYKTITKDENWSPNQASPSINKNHTTEEFKNKQDQVVLKRTYNNNNTDTKLHDTYYVYDDFGNLSFVLPPKASHLIKSNNYEITLNVLEQLAYQYKYDGRNRLIEKKVPGKDWEYIVYDKLDRPILTQDAHLRSIVSSPTEIKYWLFTKYDAFGRVAYTGRILDNSTRAELQENANNASILFESKTNLQNIGGTAVYYSNNSYPINSIDEIYTINYYDTYTNLPSGFTAPSNVYNQPITTNTKSLATVNKVRILDTNFWITTLSYYDAKARPIYSFSKNDYLKTIDVLEMKLDFVGKPLETKSTHKKTGQQDIVTIDVFTYDHAGRLQTQKQCVGDSNLISCATNTASSLDADLVFQNPMVLNGSVTHKASNSITLKKGFLVKPVGSQAAVFTIDNTTAGVSDSGELIVSNQYNDLGQLTSKNVGHTEQTPLQTVDYNYNIRGWLKGINNTNTNTTNITLNNNDLFGFKINYNMPNADGTALYNGNISQTLWKTASTNVSNNAISNQYSYTYDALNRITSGIDNTTHYNVNNITYDRNGNIITLKRKGKTSTNTNTFGIIDNLTYSYKGNALHAVDDAQSSTTKGEFIDGAELLTEYTYDLNGNMIQDLNKGISNIKYNHLNLPTQVDINGENIKYKYDATGIKQKKMVSTGAITEYAGNYIYEDNNLKHFSHPEGYVEPDGSGGFQYVYSYKDHLGNIRLSYSDADNNGAVDSSEIIEEKNYYPFGLQHKGYNNVVNGTENNYKEFQGQEFTEDLGLNTHEWKYRMSDPAIGRFWQIDPLAEDYYHNSTYAFSENRVIDAVELEGLEAVLVIDKDERPADNGTSGTSYTGSTYFLNEKTGDIKGPYKSSTYPNSKSNSDNSTKYNTLTEGDHKYNNASGHKGGTKKGLNIDDKGSRKTDGTDADGEDVTMQYVNYHSGASDKGNYNSRGSAGCITCLPSDADDFFENFNWTNTAETKGDSSGTITVQRGTDEENRAAVIGFSLRGARIKVNNAIKSRNQDQYGFPVKQQPISTINVPKSN